VLISVFWICPHHDNSLKIIHFIFPEKTAVKKIFRAVEIIDYRNVLGGSSHAIGMTDGRRCPSGHLRFTSPPPLGHSENIFDIFSDLSCFRARQISPLAIYMENQFNFDLNY
jgi:hypothetical protein